MASTLPFIPIQDCLSYASVCQYLAANEKAKQDAFSGGFLNKNIPSLIYLVRKSLAWAYGRNPSDISLIKISNYLYSLIANYIGAAKVILNTGGTGTTVNPSTGAVSAVQALNIQFIVGQPNALMTAGQTLLNVACSYPISGSQSVFYNSVPLGFGLDDRISYSVIFSDSNVRIIFDQAVQNSDLIQINLLYYASI